MGENPDKKTVNTADFVIQLNKVKNKMGKYILKRNILPI